MIRLTLCVAALSLLAGCTGGSSAYSTYPTYTAPARSVASDPHSPSIKNDPYSPTIDVKTEAAERDQGVGTQLYGLYAKIDRKSGTTLTYVQWSEVYTDRAWRFYSRASSDKGQRYAFDKVSRDVTSCRSGRCVYSETYNVTIPAAELRQGATSGISFKIYGQNGDERIVNIPATLVKDFNDKIAEANKARQAKS